MVSMRGTVGAYSAQKKKRVLFFLQVSIRVHQCHRLYLAARARIGCRTSLPHCSRQREQILDNLGRTRPAACKTDALARLGSCAHPHPHSTRPPPLALSGMSLNIHHSGCSESAVNAASHSRESLKPTLSSAPPLSIPSLSPSFPHPPPPFRLAETHAPSGVEVEGGRWGHQSRSRR